jgi:sulfur carrier protein ThiS
VKVKLMLFGHLARLLPEGSSANAAVVDVREGATIEEVLDGVGVPTEGRSYLTLNGERAECTTPVHEADELRVIVPLGGG